MTWSLGRGDPCLFSESRGDTSANLGISGKNVHSRGHRVVELSIVEDEGSPRYDGHDGKRARVRDLENVRHLEVRWNLHDDIEGLRGKLPMRYRAKSNEGLLALEVLGRFGCLGTNHGHNDGIPRTNGFYDGGTRRSDTTNSVRLAAQATSLAKTSRPFTRSRDSVFGAAPVLWA